MLNPVYTETTSCRDCYKCVRSCPVKAIQIKDGSAVIIKERCVFCGKCVDICPNKAKKIRNDVARAAVLLKTKTVYCSLAPSFASEFEGQEQELLSALMELGFAGISETSVGATIVSAAIDEYVREHDGACPWISTACPSVVELVKKYYPEEVSRLAKVPSPLQTHSAYLREIYGDDIGIVFIGPCIAKKNEADLTPGYPDVALTFDELRAWLAEEHISLEAMKGREVPAFVPAKAGTASYYPIERGQIITSEIWSKGPFCTDAIALSGNSELLDVLGQVADQMPILGLLGCEGGCITGPAASKNRSLAIRKNAVINYSKQSLEDGRELFEAPQDFVSRVVNEGYGILNAAQPGDESGFWRKFSDEEIENALRELGKTSKEDELNCGGCGYNTCRDMAAAWLAGMAEPEMCVTKMRKEAQSKVDMLLRTIPNAVVIVDENLNIADCNLNFLRIFGDMDEELLDDNMLALVKSLPLERFVPFYEKFRDEFYSTHRNQYRLHYRDKYLRVTFFLVEKSRLLGAMFEDITSNTVRRETVVKKAEDVIQKSLETVQQIASLLGENAADTEIMLNSLIDAFSVHGSDQEDGTFTLDEDQDLS